MTRHASRQLDLLNNTNNEEVELSRADFGPYRRAWASEISINLKFAIRWVDTERLTAALMKDFSYDELCALAVKSGQKTFLNQLLSQPDSCQPNQNWLLGALKLQ